MAEDRPEELKGWPVSWYVDDDFEKGYLKCPARNCPDIFKTADEVENRLGHQYLATDPVTRFQHCILLAMCQVKKCPKCPYERTTRDMGPFKIDSDIRAFLQHEYYEHGTEDLRDVQKFVGWVREFRRDLFGAKNLTMAIVLWKEVDKYHRTQIRQQSEFEDFASYLVDDCNFFLEGDWLGEINKACRDTEFPGNPKDTQLEQCQDYFPVGSMEFLMHFEPRDREPDREHVWDRMRDLYRTGYI